MLNNPLAAYLQRLALRLLCYAVRQRTTKRTRVLIGALITQNVFLVLCTYYGEAKSPRIFCFVTSPLVLLLMLFFANCATFRLQFAALSAVP